MSLSRDLSLDFVLSPDVLEIAARIRPLVHYSRERHNAINPLRDHLAACVASCDATPAEAAQAARDLAIALQRRENALGVTSDLLKDSDGPHPHHQA